MSNHYYLSVKNDRDGQEKIKQNTIDSFPSDNITQSDIIQAININ